jgi:Lon protease-like protein
VTAYRKITDLPQTIPLFPLEGAILFPRGQLPLNIFEPRYLNMVDDALAGDRLIGMIQPATHQPQPNEIALSRVGSVGRITTFAETDDGRYLITLTGICRYLLAREMPQARPYRQAVVSYEEFGTDLYPSTQMIDRARLDQALRRYVDLHGYQVNWQAVNEATPETVVNLASVLCPFDVMAKQALLEAPTIRERAEALIALLEFGDAPEAPGPLQ